MSEFSLPTTSAVEYLRPVPVYAAQQPRQRYWLHALLLVLTCFTTLVVGARMQSNFARGLPVFYVDGGTASFFPVKWALADPARLLLGIPFAGTLMLILLAHEMGHYLYCKHYGVWATLPFFIPAPTLIGTFGAFIRIRSPIRSRTSLFDIGIAGPIAGFAVAVGVLAVSLGLSRPIPAGSPPADLELGFPLIFHLVHGLLAGTGMSGVAGLPLERVLLHPMAIAAWVGMFATALNLLPGGQLDGGHIVFSIAPRAHRWISWLTTLALLAMAYYLCYVWVMWAIMLRLSSLRHPQVPEWPRVQGSRALLAVFAIVMLVLTFAPTPFLHFSLREIVQEMRRP
ncbi:MAG: site-2 protease family protein [Candidatus Sulfotelmatobacter sp.]|jgi:membrane-associated protease RseP (regulator of RpoE activity)